MRQKHHDVTRESITLTKRRLPRLQKLQFNSSKTYLAKVNDIPKSPCVHSAAWIKCDGVPVEASDADMRWAIIPDLPVVRKKTVILK
jgi:hypothetical protein